MSTLAETLARLGGEPRTEDIPPAACAAAERLLLDSLGCALAGIRQPGVAEVCALMRRWGGAPEAEVLFHDCRLPGPQAAFANSAMIHALDYDDVYSPASLHLTSVIVPAVLAAGPLGRASGADLLAAMVMGIEIAARIGLAEKGHRRGIGFLPSSLVGGFGAVIAAARLLRLDPEQTADALGIAYAQAAGNRQALLDMTLTKRLQPGFAARSALWSVELARHGITGPRRAFEGEAGYAALYLDGGPLSAEALAADRGGFEIGRVAIKRFPSCGACHPVQEAAERLMAEEPVAPEDIVAVELFGCGPGGLVGGPFRPGRHPQVAAQFCAAWGVAHTLLRGPATLEAYRDEAVAADREVAALANAIRHVPPPPDLPPTGPQPPGLHPGAYRPHGVIVRTRDGRSRMRVRTQAQVRDPAAITRSQVETKFRDCARHGGLRDEARIQHLLDRMSALRDAPDVAAWLRPFCLPPQPLASGAPP